MCDGISKEGFDRSAVLQTPASTVVGAITLIWVYLFASFTFI